MRTVISLSVVAFAATACLCEALAGESSPTYEIDFGMEQETLDKSFSGWSTKYFHLKHSGAHQGKWRAGWRETERFALHDQELHVGGNWQAGDSLVLGMEAGYSDTHRILPARYGQVDLALSTVPGWVINAGGRISIYDIGRTRIFHVGVDRYWGSERFGATLFAGGPEGSAMTSSYRLQWTHDYANDSWFGVSLTQGRETENLGVSGFLTSRIRGLAISGRHAVNSAWAITWGLGNHLQGAAYRRTGATLGLRHVF